MDLLTFSALSKSCLISLIIFCCSSGIISAFLFSLLPMLFLISDAEGENAHARGIHCLQHASRQNVWQNATAFRAIPLLRACSAVLAETPFSNNEPDLECS
ncbi:MAG: hypothetical protein ACPGGG_03800, partial [Parvibaculales bacterium]